MKIRPADTSGLFYRALFYSLYNDVVAKPNQREKGTLENLLIGKMQIEKAISLGMSSLKAKVLRTQLYNDIAYPFTGEEAWMFSKEQIDKRRTEYSSYKDLANKYYNELRQLDKNNAWDYQRLKIKKSDYPVK